ncbi:MAG: LysR family transcriptional regulator [Pseudomonadota bacterium]
MEAFTTVVDEGGFTGAARKLGISKSAVSKHVASLEARLGARLLNRTTRRVNPTEIGLYYYDRAREVLSAASEAEHAVSSLHRAPAGFLRVAASTDFGNRTVSRMLGQFLERYPEISADLTLTDSVVDMNSEDYDIVLRLGKQPDQALRTVKICNARYRLVASPDYVRSKGMPERIEDLGAHETLQVRHSLTESSWTLISPTGEMRVVHNRGRLAVNDATALAEAARQGLGIAFLPEFLVKADLEDGALVEVLDSLPPQTQPVFVILPKGEITPTKVQALIDYLIEASNNGAFFDVGAKSD